MNVNGLLRVNDLYIYVRFFVDGERVVYWVIDHEQHGCQSGIGLIVKNTNSKLKWKWKGNPKRQIVGSSSPP